MSKLLETIKKNKPFGIIYLTSLIVFYLIVILISFSDGISSGPYGPSGPFAPIAMTIMGIFFGIPLLIALIYFFLNVKHIFKKDWESLKYGILIVCILLIIGAGVCFSNLVVLGSV